MLRALIVVAMVTGCKDSAQAPVVDRKPAPVVIDAAPIPDAARDAAVTNKPTAAQALEAGKRWLAAAGTKDPKALLAASALPFKLSDAFTRPRCESAVIADAGAFTKIARCLQQEALRSTVTNTEHEASIEASLVLPEPDQFAAIAEAEWNALVPAADRATHAFVTFANGHPKYFADVLYILLSVKLVEGTPTVDGAVLVLTSQGD